MTAEVGVLNQNGVALAADSAVTVGSETSKIYTSADKLFQLSEVDPVGIMVYGSASLLNVPWETIIKTFRSQSKKESLPHLTDYVDKFKKFLKNERLMFSMDVQLDFVKSTAESFMCFLRDKGLKYIDTVLQKKGPLEEEEIPKILFEFFKKELTSTRKIPKFDNLPSTFRQKLRKLYQTEFKKIKKRVFENLPLTAAASKYINELLFELFSRRRLEEGGFHSGVVIAGFGEEEHYPTLVEIAVDGVVGGCPLLAKVETVKIGRKAIACVAPFAQKEMVLTFLNGIDPDIENVIKDSTGLLFGSVIDIIINKVKEKDKRFGNKLEQKIRPTFVDLMKRFNANLNETRITRYSDPVLKMVASQTKEELGAMAESLVNLTKFKRRASEEKETVGGPIDVAVITKGDGFVWVKRKHYFPQELNLRYLAKLNRGVCK